MANKTINQSWELAEPQRIDPEKHPNINWSEAAKFSEERIKVLQNLFQVLKQEEEPFVTKERGTLESSIRFFEAFNKSSEEFIKQEEENIRKVKIKEEIQAHRPEEQKHNAIIAETQNSINKIQEDIENAVEQQKRLLQKRKDVVDTIDPMELSKIKFKDFLDPSNEIFKWCVQAIYKESKTNYAWENFKKQVFGKDKGKDFIMRLKGTNLQKLRKDDFVYAKTIMEQKAATLVSLQPKGKENLSLKHYFEFIEIVVQIGDYHDQVENGKQTLEEKQRELEKKSSDILKIHNQVKMLEDKIAASTHYIETLKKIKPIISSSISMIKDRIASQHDYLHGLKDTVHVHIEEESFGQNQQKFTEQPVKIVEEAHVHHEQKELKHQLHETPKFDHGQTAEEENFEGTQIVSHSHIKKVESKVVPTVELKESEFANDKSGCQSCAMF